MSTCARRVKCILLSYAMGIAGGTLFFVWALPGLAAHGSVIRELKHDVSLPLRSLAFPSATVTTADEREESWDVPEGARRLSNGPILRCS